MVYLQATLDATFAALADPTRRAILSRLARRDLTIKEIAGNFDMTLPAVSKHVRVLERAGLAAITREGRARRTTLVAAPMRAAAEWIETYRQFWEHRLNMLATYVEGVTSSEGSWQPTSRKPRPPRSKSGARSARRASASSRRSQTPRKSPSGARPRR